MKYVFELLIILLISFISEILNAVIPLPIPASVYGLIILFALLCLKIVKVEQVETVSKFLLAIMPLFFIPAGVGLLTSVDVIKQNLIPILVIMILTTIIVMVVTGLVAQAIIKGRKK